jgi:hypothetical protein
VESCYKSNQKARTPLHLKHYLMVVSTLMLLNVGTFMESKELPQEMLFFLATSFMIWSLQRVLFVQHLFLGETILHHTHNVVSRD